MPHFQEYLYRQQQRCENLQSCKYLSLFFFDKRYRLHKSSPLGTLKWLVYVIVTVLKGMVKQLFIQFVGLFPGQVPEESYMWQYKLLFTNQPFLF